VRSPDFAREHEIAMTSKRPGTLLRSATRASQILDWVAFAILFIFIGIAIIH